MKPYRPPDPCAPPGVPVVEDDYLVDLLFRLRDKLAGLRGRGCVIRWITAGREELVRLFEEGGDDIVLLDPDPRSDRAWLEGYEFRPSKTPGVFVYLEGENGQMSRYCI